MTAATHDTTSNWTFEGEIVRFLELAASQIEVALREGDAPVEELSAVVADLATSMQRLGTQVGASPGAATELAVMGERLRSASVALQFYDRLSQRLTHARDSLAALGVAVGQRHQHDSRDAWNELRDRIRSQYSMEQERLMFDLLVRGASADQVLDMLKGLREGGTAGHVDLF